MADILPAIIPKSYSDLEEKLAIVKDEVSWVHIDIVDGTMGGKPSWPIENDNGDFKKIKDQERGLPFWEDFDFEVHLMTDDPLAVAHDWIDAGVSRIIFHVESLDYDRDILFLDQLKSQAIVEVGIAINADTATEDLKPYLQVADCIHVMTIPKIGSQGAEFYPRGLDHVRWIKENYSHMVVSVDGAIRPETAEICLDAGADRLIVGSFIFGSSNPREALEEMKSLV